ncbi:MAG: GNAT family N-acetyltransferase [Thermoplasmatales archaeon]|jgi:GNAT superfamily N-acetyltransferase|nr:GNAT family N-acetyltransferase [Candidatus Thermoplasmatota archaeon]MCL6002800.1 GNAT family N-acetyltransferase [Candidatus Thermoplasmatota archaeon]MDA8056125.1 GNAT family N-acetyltransferase [Thermoplasmatales archaeon]
MEEFSLSFGDIDDIEMLVDHRILMWKDIHPDMDERIEETRLTTREWIESKFSEGVLTALIVKNREGEVVGSGCILVREDQPRPGSVSMKHPYLLSMYTLPKFRKKGVASLIVKAAIDWSKDNKFDRITLHASDQGKTLYEKLGFQQTNEMRLKL